MMSYGIYSTTVQIEFIEDFPDGVNQVESCFYGSAYGGKNRVFTTTPVYKHCVGCPHLFKPCSEDSHSHEHDHEHDHKKKDKGKKKHDHSVDDNHDHDDSSENLA